MKMDIELMQPVTVSSVASADNEDAASNNGSKEASWIWTYFVSLREEGTAVCQVPKLRGGSSICGATYVCTSMSGTKNLAKHLMSNHQIHDKQPEQGAMRAYLKSEYLKVCASHKLIYLSLI